MDATSKHHETTIVHLLLPNCGLRTLQCNNYYLNNWIDLKHKWTKKKLVNLKKIIWKWYQIDVKDIKCPLSWWVNHESLFLTIGFKIACQILSIGVDPSLGSTNRNHFKDSLRNQNWPNHFPGPFPLNVFTTNFFFMFIHYML
jgi:hypothetical protein